MTTCHPVNYALLRETVCGAVGHTVVICASYLRPGAHIVVLAVIETAELGRTLDSENHNFFM